MSPENVGKILALARAIGTNLWSATAGKKFAATINPKMRTAGDANNGNAPTDWMI
jgi:hypothetical protein